MSDIMKYAIIVFFVFIFLVILLVHLLKKRKVKYYKGVLDKLEINKNLVGSIPISLELSKIEELNKNNELDLKIKEFNDRLDEIKNVMLPKVDDMLIELDTFFDKKDYNMLDERISKSELEIYKVREYSNALLADIKELTSSDEKYRSLITKLKTKYRGINKEFQNHKNLYDEMQDAISMQLENVEKRFLDFEKAMEEHQYNEVVHIVKALTTMIDHLSTVVEETPDLVLMCKQVLPSKLKEVEEINNSMENEDFILDYLNIPYNIEESRKKVDNILDRIRVLNLEDCMFEVETMVTYLDSLFVDFEKERLSRKVFEEVNGDFSKKLKSVNKAISDVIGGLDKIKNTYDMKNKDIKEMEKLNKDLIVINDDYNKLKMKLENKASPYSELHKEIEDLTNRLKVITESLDLNLKSLGNMYDDEQRAREQLEEIEKFLKVSKDRIHSIKLPVIPDKYFTELNEANEAIREVIKELSSKPIVINTLNTRVDTARDLVLKLYNTTNELVKDAYFSENLIIYANRFRYAYHMDKELNKAASLFMKGSYKESINSCFKAIKEVNMNIYNRVYEMYNSEK